MTQSKATIDYGTVYQGTAAAAGGTFVADYAIPIETGARLVAIVILSDGGGTGRLVNFASLRAEYVVENNHGTLNAPAAIPTPASTNPLNSSTAGEAAAHVQASDAAFNNSGGGFYPSAVWSISGTNARLTVTNRSATAVVADVTVVISAIIAGST